ncbi:MAG: aminoacyl-tRNA hydrolase [Phycisphaerales bacterium]|nr:aminoacyl-tRNA hydrolase [Phycisphaerales bacterium]
MVGLGNPGLQYARTRHNVGFEAIDRLARRVVNPAASAGVGCARARFNGLTLEADIGDQRVLLLKPTTFMNRSGKSVAEAIGFFKMDAATDLLVIADDIDLPCGSLRIRGDGGAGGHNGLADILAALGSPQWSRCRIGIDKPGIIPQADYVLGRFTDDQAPQVDECIDQACLAVQVWCREGLAASMNQFNKKVTANAGEPPHNSN